MDKCTFCAGGPVARQFQGRISQVRTQPHRGGELPRCAEMCATKAGQGITPGAAALAKFAAFWGSNNVDHQARICHSTTVAGVANTWGYGAMTNSYNDIHLARAIFLIGGNPAYVRERRRRHRQCRNGRRLAVQSGPVHRPDARRDRHIPAGKALPSQGRPCRLGRLDDRGATRPSRQSGVLHRHHRGHRRSQTRGGGFARERGAAATHGGERSLPDHGACRGRRSGASQPSLAGPDRLCPRGDRHHRRLDGTRLWRAQGGGARRHRPALRARPGGGRGRVPHPHRRRPDARLDILFCATRER